jgi:hypothetical protein
MNDSTLCNIIAVVITEESLTRLRPLIESRAARGIPRDTHGDLRLDHIYLLPDRNPPDKLAVIDCIEFNERFRFADPVADMAFLVMDLAFHGRRDLARVFADEYFRASSDEEGRVLLSFYTAYRAVVRAKVEGLELLETEIPEAERTRAAAKSRAHWLLALGELEAASRRPCLVLVGGLLGTGKSTLARGLVREANFRLVRSDVVRKELAGLPPGASARSSFGEGIYTQAWSDKTYAGARVMLRRSYWRAREFSSTLASAKKESGAISWSWQRGLLCRPSFSFASRTSKPFVGAWTIAEATPQMQIGLSIGRQPNGGKRWSLRRDDFFASFQQMECPSRRSLRPSACSASYLC